MSFLSKLLIECVDHVFLYFSGLYIYITNSNIEMVSKVVPVNCEISHESSNSFSTFANCTPYSLHLVDNNTHAA